MSYEELYYEFLKLFPDDKDTIQEIAKTADAEPADGMHIMFGMVVVPFIIKLIEDNEEFKIKTAFDFFEKMAESEDSLISEVLEFTILEDLISRDKHILEKCRVFMGRKTMESCSVVENYMM